VVFTSEDFLTSVVLTSEEVFIFSLRVIIFLLSLIDLSNVVVGSPAISFEVAAKLALTVIKNIHNKEISNIFLLNLIIPPRLYKTYLFSHEFFY